MLLSTRVVPPCARSWKPGIASPDLKLISVLVMLKRPICMLKPIMFCSKVRQASSLSYSSPLSIQFGFQLGRDFMLPSTQCYQGYKSPQLTTHINGLLACARSRINFSITPAGLSPTGNLQLLIYWSPVNDFMNENSRITHRQQQRSA